MSAAVSHPTAVQRTQELLARLPAAWRFGLAAWAGMRLLLNGWGALAVRLAPPGGDAALYHGLTPLDSALGAWQRWDAIHYLRLAQGGYSETMLSAFFPLYPLLGRLVALATPAAGLRALLIVSDLAAIAALVLIYTLSAQAFGARAARWAGLALVAFPGAFFLFAPYADGLALALTLGAFTAALRRRWPAAALLGLCAGLTHPTVLPLAAGLGWLALTQPEGRNPAALLGRLAAAAAPLLGLALFLAWRAAQGFPSYTAVQNTYWGWTVTPPWALAQALFSLPANPFFPLTGWLNVLVLGLALAALWDGRRELPPALLVYFGAGFLLLLSTSRAIEPLASWSRHSLLLFPLFLVMGRRLAHGRAAALKLALLFALNLYAAGLFFAWIWVA